MDSASGYAALTMEDAEYLKGVAVLPDDIRRQLLMQWAGADGRGVTDLARLFAAFIGLANSVVANNREVVDVLGWLSGETHPDRQSGANLPTIFGALQGVEIASRVPSGQTCDGCAFRRGTPANQSPITTLDARDCTDDREPFMCHERALDANGEPTRLCVGYAMSLRAEPPA